MNARWIAVALGLTALVAGIVLAAAGKGDVWLVIAFLGFADVVLSAPSPRGSGAAPQPTGAQQSPLEPEPARKPDPALEPEPAPGPEEDLDDAADEPRYYIPGVPAPATPTKPTPAVAPAAPPTPSRTAAQTSHPAAQRVRSSRPAVDASAKAAQEAIAAARSLGRALRRRMR